tara:strand:+ start:480 stop:2483 length:2004 start_codon:yes stop_codon:yes gene_type:complete
MKRIPHFNLLSIFFLLVVLSNSSCSSEDLLSEIIAQNEEPPPTGEEPTDPTPPISTNALDINTTPCDYTLATLTANETLKVSCQLDLEGQTIALPANVILEYDGGEIINGALTFSGGKIDGDLLNQNLEVSGTVVLINPTFTFHPERWDIFQGKTNSDRALENTLNLEKLFYITKDLGGSTFTIDEFDAFFETGRITPPNYINYYPHKEAVNLPSDFNLVMTDNTHLRIQPANAQTENLGNGAVLSVNDGFNVTVTGGTLHGDRDIRYYSADDGQEGTHLFYIHSGTNVTLKNIKFVDGAKGALSINSRHFTTNPDYIPTNNVKVLNCEFKNIRRMAIALTDGRNILIEGNSFINTGQASANSNGGEVGYAINMEATRSRDENGELVLKEKVTDVIIRGNIERGSRAGSITISIAENITIEDNDLETKVVYSYTSGSKILNNKFTASEESSNTPAIFATGDGDTVFNNEIGGNEISGYSAGINAASYDMNIHDNIIKNCLVGLQIGKVIKLKITNNDINVSRSGIQATNTFADDVEISGNTIAADKNHIYIINLNSKEGEQDNTGIVFSNNIFTETTMGTISRSRNIVFKDNIVQGGLQVGSSENIQIENNEITPIDTDGIRLYDTALNIDVLNNTISIPTGSSRYSCVNNSVDNPSEVTENGNTCN